MNLRPGDAADFFAPSSTGEGTKALRRALLDEAASHYAVLPASSGDLVAETLEFFAIRTGRRFADAFEAGIGLEADWVLLRPDQAGCFRVEAGVVCFPSEWSLPEKAGLPLAEVHAPVPKLNEALGRQIDTFLAKLAPGTEWERENWGLSADDQLDHHPRHFRPHLAGTETIDRVWIRLERQLLVRLSGGGVIFGIHVSNHRLDEVTALRDDLAKRIALALRTMPEEAAVYKGIAEARLALADRLDSVTRLTPGFPR